jgi:hypothetical protein
MLLFLKALTRLMLQRIQSSFMGKTKKEFHHATGSTFAVRKGMRGSLVYREGGSEYLVNASEGDGYSIVIEHIADADIKLASLPTSEKVRIAKNIRDVLLRDGVNAEVIHEHRVLAVES